MKDRPDKIRNAVTIIGLGRVGLNLLRLAHRRGLNISGGWDPEPEARRAAKDIVPAADFPDSLLELSGDIDTLLVAVPDPLLPVLAEQILPLLEHNPGCLVAFTSGTASSQDLASLNASGADYGTMHPVQSFHNNHLPAEALENIGCGIEGSDRFLVRASALAQHLGWKPVEVDAKEKLLYHTACVMAGNFITVLAADAGTLLSRAGSKQDTAGTEQDTAGTKQDTAGTEQDTSVSDQHPSGSDQHPSGSEQHSSIAPLLHMAPLLGMMRTVLDRLEEQTPSSALTGPASRGDAETIEREVQLLRDRFPEIAPLYIECTRRAAALAGLPEDEFNNIEKALRSQASPGQSQDPPKQP